MQVILEALVIASCTGTSKKEKMAGGLTNNIITIGSVDVLQSTRRKQSTNHENSTSITATEIPPVQLIDMPETAEPTLLVADLVLFPAAMQNCTVKRHDDKTRLG